MADAFNPFGPPPPGWTPPAPAAAAGGAALPTLPRPAPPSDAMRNLLAARNAAFAPAPIRSPAPGAGAGAGAGPAGARSPAAAPSSQSSAGSAGSPSRGAGAGAGAGGAPLPKAWQSAGLLHQPDWALDVTSDECGGQSRLKGETPVITDVECYFRVPTSGQRVRGTLAATTYQLRFQPGGPLPAALRHLPPSFFCVPVASVRKVERSKVVGGGSLQMAATSAGGSPATPADAAAHLVEVTCKDVRVLWLGFADEFMASTRGARARASTHTKDAARDRRAAC